jgi:hypothetical protein
LAKLFFLVLILFIAPVNAQTQKISTTADESVTIPKTSELKTQIRNQLEFLSVNKEINLLREIKSVNEKLLNYSAIKKKECDGEFSVLEIVDTGETSQKSSKLSPEEKKSCYQELFSFRKEVTSELFNLRRNLLKENHQKEIYELEQHKSEALAEIDKLSKKIISK